MLISVMNSSSQFIAVLPGLRQFFLVFPTALSKTGFPEIDGFRRTRCFLQNSTVLAELDQYRNQNLTVIAELDQYHSQNMTVLAELSSSCRT